jgi:hypothetical protein
MKIKVPSSLIHAADSPLVVDAVYFVVRVLRNALRGYPKTEVSTEPSPQARRLAENAVTEIEAAEHMRIAQIEDDQIRKYISKLESFLTDRTAPISGSQLSDAKRLLRQMRSQRT